MSFTDSAKHVLATVAPLLATATLGPFAPIANAAIAAVFGIKTDDAAATATALASATPDQLLALKQADDAFKVQMEQLGISEEKLAFDDVSNARGREIAVKDSTPKQLAWMLIGGFLTISLAQIVAMVGWADQVNKIPAQGWLLIGNISGYLANEAKQAGAYYFGTTMGSQSKDLTIADIAKKP